MRGCACWCRAGAQAAWLRGGVAGGVRWDVVLGMVGAGQGARCWRSAGAAPAFAAEVRLAGGLRCVGGLRLKCGSGFGRRLAPRGGRARAPPLLGGGARLQFGAPPRRASPSAVLRAAGSAPCFDALRRVAFGAARVLLFVRRVLLRGWRMSRWLRAPLAARPGVARCAAALGAGCVRPCQVPRRIRVWPRT